MPPVVISDGQIDSIKNAMPIMPDELRAKLEHLGLSSSAVETLVDNLESGKFMLAVLDHADAASAKRVANWLVVDVQSLIVKQQLTWAEAKLDAEAFAALAKMAEESYIGSSAATQIVQELVRSGGDPLQIAKNKDLLQVSDEGAIEEIVKQVLSDYPKAAEDVKNGEMKAIGFLVGQVMKASQGKANPSLAQQLIKKQLDS